MKAFFRQLGVFLLFGLLCAVYSVQAQQPRKKLPVRKPAAASDKPKAADPTDEKARFDAAVAAATPAEKAELLVKFIADYPGSANRQRAEESLTVARAALADEALTAGDPDRAVKLFRAAVDEAPKPYPDRLFAEVISLIPANLYWRGHRNEAYEIARSIEANVATDAKKLAAMAGFYAGVEDGTEAKRVAEAAIKVDEASAAGYQALGMADRLNFDLEGAETAFAKALELDADSALTKRMLAEMKRALGKSDEAAALYQDILSKDENDIAARTGHVLSLFDSGKRSEAEAALSAAIEKTPGNVFLLAGAAYWYAANGEGVKAEELARQAIAKEPRLIWSHIALGRGLMAQGKPVDAEQVLIAARKYGNFPTLQYEIASARFAAGFYRDAAEELRRSFSVDADGVHSKLGGRIERSANNFTDLISFERRASIFTPASADSPKAAEQMRALLELEQVLSAEKPDEAAAVSAAERFAAGSDDMSTYRSLYAARALNDKQVAPSKALEYAQSAVASVDKALTVSNPGAAVMASELYEARATAFSNDDFLLIPEVPKQTLSALLRGRIEELSGVALLQSGNAPEATLKFRRALSVYPKDSAWWRSATWNLGQALEADGKNEEALRAYIASYKIDKPSISRYVRISALYTKVNGSDSGLEAAIGPSPLANAVASTRPVAAAPAEPVPPPVEAVAERPAAVKRLPPSLPVADPNGKPLEVKTEPSNSADDKKEGTPSEVVAAPKQEELKAGVSVPEDAKTPESEKPQADEVKQAPTGSVDEKPAEEKPIEAEPLEEKPSDPKPAAERISEAKKPETAENKALEEKKGEAPTTSAGDKPVEEKVEPAAVPAEAKPKGLPNEVKPPEKKDPPAEVPADAPKDDVPVATPAEADKTPETEPAIPATERSDTRKLPDENEKPRSGTRPRLAVVKTDLPPPPPKVETLKIPPRKARPAVKDTPSPADPGRPLFEPVVIKIPGSNKPKAEEPAASPTDQRTDPPDATATIPEEGSAKRCYVGVSQENLTISGVDGSVALLVSVTEGVDVSTLRAASNSEEVEVRREPLIAGIDDRVVYVLRSVSGKAGIYQVTFSAPCGKKTVNVSVR